MQTMKIAPAIIAAALTQQAMALDFAPAGAQLAPIGWAAVDSSYAAAARQVELGYPGDAGYSPEEFAATVEKGLEERLESRLEQDLNAAEAEPTRSASTN